MKEEQLKNISFIKTIMMLFVVLCHSMMFFGSEWFTYIQPVFHANYLYKFALWTNTFHIQTFTMASGFLYFYLREVKNKYNNSKEFILKKTKRLIIPFIFTCIFWVIPFAVYYFHYDLSQIFNRYVLMRQPNQLWFLIMLFLVFAIITLVYKRIKISFIGLIIIYIFSITIGTALGHFNINFFQIDKAITYFLYFYFGGYIYKFNKNISIKQIIIISCLLPVIIITINYMSNSGLGLLYYLSVLLQPVISLIEILIIYYICSIIAKKSKSLFNNKIYTLLEENSFGIYLFHQQIIYFTITILNGIVHPIIQTLLSFSISIIISLIICLLLKKKKITRFMFGL